jgi:glycine dehydrogenase subunit 1
MPYFPHTQAEREAMLETIGLPSLEALFEDVPRRLRFPRLDLPPATSEFEVEQELAHLAARNLDMQRRPCFLGAGSYRHYVPATVDAVLERGELATAYTPYQPELSQGALQAMFEYQSMICALTGMDVATASHYDGSTALAEAVLMALAAGGDRRKVLLAPTLHPQYRQVVETYLQGADAQVAPAESGATSEDVIAQIDSDTAACVVQSPNFFGQFESVPRFAEAARNAGALLIVVPDPISLGLFRSPGEEGADLVAAEGQPLGIPLGYGGPHLGILAVGQAHVRRVPGRLVGETVDTEGERGYVLTLTAREQHIRRHRATSNICTNAALMALAAAVYLATLGRSGLRQVATLCYQKSHYAAQRIATIPGCRVNPQAPDVDFFKEFVVELPVAAARVNERLLDEFDTIGGYDLAGDDPQQERRLLVAVTETNARAEIDALVDALDQIVRSEGATR